MIIAESKKNRAEDSMQTTEQQASQIAEMMYELLMNCQEKEERLSVEFHVSVLEFRTLRMFHQDRRLTIKKLVERVGLSGSRLSRILKSLEEKGYIERTIDADDRRSIDVSLTLKGSAFVRALEERYVQIHQEILRGIPQEMQEPLMRGMRTMLCSLQGWLRNA